MIQYDELKRLAEAATQGTWTHLKHGVIKGGPAVQFTNGSSQQQIVMTTGADWMKAGEQYANADFIAAANPAAVLALIAENEQLAKTADCWDRLSVYNKALSDSFRAERDQSEQDYKDVVGTIELRDIEIAKLRAEVAGLRTGYEAYERVNAELKAEVEALRREREGKVLCDLELFETLRDSANTEADEHRQCMATYRPLRQANLDSVVKKCDDLLAALGKGEQS